MNLMLIPLQTTIMEAKIVMIKRRIGETSLDLAFNLSSIIPITNTINAAEKMAIVILSIGRIKMAVIRAPKNIGIPPPLGVGLE